MVALAADSLEVRHEHTVRFDADLPQFGTTGGVLRQGDCVTAPPGLWLAALDLALSGIKDRGCPMDRVVAISGSGQQHGSVYWKRGAGERLAAMQSDVFDADRLSLADVLDASWFTRDAPVWMDNSTTEQCREITAQLGSAQALADITGSSAYERFTGPQIRRFWQTQPEAFAQTERISLVSSFLASVLVGAFAPIDVADGSGMNLLDIRRRRWCDAALDATAPGLRALLGDEPVDSWRVVGCVSRFVARRFGLAPACQVVAFSGDNPCSCAGLRLAPGDVALSLGTSDTLFAVFASPSPLADAGHVFCSPTARDAYMALLCFKNGSLVREALRDRLCGRSWTQFNALLARTPPGNEGRVGFFFPDPEILPRNAHGTARFGADDAPLAAFDDAAAEVRALVESQFLSMRLHAAKLGIAAGGRLVVTGGASSNAAIVQVAADVFGVSAFAGDSTDSASRGAAYRAAHGWRNSSSSEQQAIIAFDAVAPRADTHAIATPDAEAHAVYSRMMPRFEALLRRHCNL